MDKPSVLIQQRSFPNQNATDEEKATIEYGLKVAKAIEGEWFKKNTNSCTTSGAVMNFLAKMLSGEGEQYPSSKRTITFLAFLLLATGFVAEMFFEKRVNPQTFDTMMYIVLGGLGFTASEKFVSKEKK